ncbi:MAG: lipopolysaccharide biosynthesis protein [Eubacteriales bacterium]|nr:lipopolysaccharide biosynthesis protein [Eubacteriales bacterium]
MSRSRTKNTAINIATAIASQAATVIMSFFTRTALIRTLGIQAVSLNGLFAEIITMLSLAELGVGSAIVYNLYKPLSENDEKKVCQLMTLFQTAYRTIALVIFAVGLLLTPFIQYLVNDISYPLSYIRLVYVLFVIQSASSYLFAYKASLLVADQKKYMVTIITLAAKAVSVVAIVAVLYLTGNYILYLLIQILFNFGSNMLSALYADRTYPYLRKDRSMSKEERKGIFKNVKYLFVDSLSNRIVNSTDNILISVLVSTLQVGYYSNYSVFFGIIRQLQTNFSGGISGSLGNLLATETPEHCVRVLGRLNYLFYVAAFVLNLGMFACVGPVVRLWLGEDFLLPGIVVFISCLNLFLDFCKAPVWQTLGVAGRFKENKNISIAGAVTNLVISVVLGVKLGMAGIFIGTTATTLVQLVLKTRLLYGKVFRCSAGKFAARWVYYLLSFVTAQMGILWFASVVRLENVFAQILVNGVAAVALSIPFCILVFWKNEDFRYALDLVRTRAPFDRRRKQGGEE